MRMASRQERGSSAPSGREVVLALFLVSLVSCAAPGKPDPANSAVSAAEACADFFSTRSWSDRAEPHFQAISPAIACFDGDMDERLPGQVESWLAEGPPNLSRLLAVRSPGGDAAQGISAAELLQRRGVAVYVHEVCASSCANYLFGGATRRMVSPDALILFHGGFSEASRSGALAMLDAFLSSPAGAQVTNPDENRREVAADIDRNIERQRQLFAAAGVSEDIVLAVERLDVDRLDSVDCAGAEEAPRRFVFFTPEQLSSMGVQIEHGRPADLPIVVNGSIRALGGDFVACRFPAGSLE